MSSAQHPLDLQDKVVVVTGGNRGIGLGMASGLLAAGARLDIWGSNPEVTEKAGAELAEAFGADRVLHQQVDVRDKAVVDEALERTIARFGRVDSLIANAGIGGGEAKPFHEKEQGDFDRVAAVNINGLVYSCQAAVRHMVDRAGEGDAGGSLLLIASIAAVDGAARSQPYAATKGAVVSMMRGLAVEYARYGIRCNAVLPGWIATDMTALSQSSDVFQEKVISRVPKRRWGKPEDFAGVAVYLASDAAAFHTGDCLVVDGGYSVF